MPACVAATTLPFLSDETDVQNPSGEVFLKNHLSSSYPKDKVGCEVGMLVGVEDGIDVGLLDGGEDGVVVGVIVGNLDG